MAKLAGRRVRVFQGTGTGRIPFAGGRSDTITINNEAIDVTDKTSEGWRTLLDDASVRSVDISIEGQLDGDDFLVTGFGATNALLSDYEVEFEGMGTIIGEFHFSTIDLNNPHDDASTYTINLLSSGEITYVPVT